MMVHRKMIYVTAPDKTARLWDADTGKVAAVLEGHTGLGAERGVQPRWQAHRHRVFRQDGAAVGRRHRQRGRRPMPVTDRGPKAA